TPTSTLFPYTTLFRSGFDEPREFAGIVVEAGEHRLQIGDADVFGENLAEHRTKIRGQPKVAAFVELMIVQAGPFAVNLSAAHIASHHKHAIRMAMVRAAI